MPKKTDLNEDEINIKKDKELAEARIKIAKANQEERKDKHQDRQLVDINDVRFLIQRSADACRKEVYRIARVAAQINPTRKSCDVCGCPEPHVIEEMINAKIDEAFANFQKVNLT